MLKRHTIKVLKSFLVVKIFLLLLMMNLAMLLCFSLGFGRGMTQLKAEIIDIQPLLPNAEEISGIVIDERGLALAGVTIRVKNSQKGTVSDGEGRFSLEVEKTDTLEFSYLGYEKNTVVIGENKTLQVILVAQSDNLNEVVVVGFGKQKKLSVTGAVASIEGRELRQSPASNLAVSLAGRLPGLTAIQRSGQPGRDITNLYIRGRGTTNEQSPIILVDGIERDLNFIDPNEIQSVTILKDASSTAVFGVRGANGVILVTTKRGIQEKPEISLRAETGIQDFPRMIKPVNSFEYSWLKNLALTNDGLDPEFSAFDMESYKDQADPQRYPNTNWNKILMKQFAPLHRYNLNINGGGEFVRYFVNAGYLHQGGQFNVEKGLDYNPEFKLDRYNFRSNIDADLTNSLVATLNVAGYFEKRNNPYVLGDDDPMEWLIYFMNRIPSISPGPVTPEGDVITYGDVDRPAYGLINRSGYIQQTTSNVMATFALEQKLDFVTEGLSIKGALSFDTRSVNNLAASRTYQKVIQIIDKNTKDSNGMDSIYYRAFNDDEDSPLSIGGDRLFATRTNSQFFANYDNDFGVHHVTGLALLQRSTTIINNDLPFRYQNFAFRGTYDFNNKYFFEFNAGINGSEQFAKNKRFGFFPAISAGWMISNEDFLKDNEWLSSLKLRGSYGKVGNDRLGDRRFLYLDDVQVVGDGMTGSLFGGREIATSLLKNEDLSWETAKKINLAVEVGLFHDFLLTIDFFEENRDNILINRGTIPMLNGYSPSVLPPANIGKVKNRGYELEATYKKAFNSDLSMMGRINFNYARNKRIAMDEPLLSEDYAFRYRETGYPIGQRFGYIVEGYFRNIKTIENSPEQIVGGHETKPGDFKYKDLNKDGVVDIKDYAPIGYSRVPEYQFGLSYNINYKNFDFSFLIQGITNVSQYYTGQGVFSSNGVRNFVERHLKSWTEDRYTAGAEIDYPRLTSLDGANPNENANSFFIIDASYLRLKNVEIGYTLPINISSKIFSKNIRFYANGLNILTWDRLPFKEIDPEQSTGSSYPNVRIFNFGVNLTF